jgi:N utilization substance protein A
MKDGYDSLMGVAGVNIGLADILYEKGFFSAEELGNAAIEDLIQIRGIDDEGKAQELINNARIAIQNTKSKALSKAEEEEEEKLSEGSIEEEMNAQSGTDVPENESGQSETPEEREIPAIESDAAASEQEADKE